MVLLAFPHFALSSRRLKSFDIGWENLSDKRRSAFVNGGFFGINLNDIVVCVLCGNPEDDWLSNEKPLDRHLENNPTCAGLRRQWKVIPTQVQPLSGLHPRYATYLSRISTFGLWPKQITQRPRALALAGLFYKNEWDRVICFMCGINLMQWNAKDSPLKEHMKFSPSCIYAKSLWKGVTDIFIETKKTTSYRARKKHRQEEKTDVSKKTTFL